MYRQNREFLADCAQLFFSEQPIISYPQWLRSASWLLRVRLWGKRPAVEFRRSPEFPEARFGTSQLICWPRPRARSIISAWPTTGQNPNPILPEAGFGTVCRANVSLTTVPGLDRLRHGLFSSTNKKVPCYWGVLRSADLRRMKLFWKEDNRIRSSIASTGALRGLICSDYRKFSTRTMSLLNASNWV
jgi:hypothetical protein